MYVIYHERDFDGFCSGAICKKKYPDAVLIGYDYGQPIPYDQMEAGKPIIMVDCSLPMADMVTLGMYSRKQFTWIDHHASAIKDYETLLAEDKTKASYIDPVLKQGIAACEITWQYLFPDEEMPIPVLLLGQYDTWRNSNKLYWERTVLPFQYGMKLNSIQEANDFPQDLLNPYDKDVAKVVDNIINNGHIALQYQRNTDQTNMQGAFETEFEGLKVIACNGAGFGSMAFDSIPELDKYDIMMPFKYDGEKWIFSLYTAKDNIDCSVLAKKYGGGGHVGAAGMSFKELPEFITKKTINMNIEQIAKICHEANKALCETQGDYSQPSWTTAPDWQKSSAIAGVKFHLDNPDAGTDDSHNSWLKEKEETGWKYGPVKDAEKKEHPCFVPYEELPDSQKAKDYLFRGIVHSLAGFVE